MESTFGNGSRAGGLGSDLDHRARTMNNRAVRMASEAISHASRWIRAELSWAKDSDTIFILASQPVNTYPRVSYSLRLGRSIV
jgi:hypothetical protein